MPKKSDNGLAETIEAFDRIARAPRETVRPALIKAAHMIADAQETWAQSSRDTGALIDSISITMPGRTTPPYSQPGGSRVAGETEVIITAGDADTRYVHLVEFGTSHSEAQPFFWPGYRQEREPVKRLLDRTAKKAVKDAWNKK